MNCPHCATTTTKKRVKKTKLGGRVAKIFKPIKMMHTQKSYPSKTSKSCTPFPKKRLCCCYSRFNFDELKNFCNTTEKRAFTFRFLARFELLR